MSALPTAPDPDTRHERACLVALSSLDGVGPGTVRACATAHGAGSAWDAVRSGAASARRLPPFAELERRSKRPDLLARMARDAAAIDPQALLSRHEAAGQRVVAFGEPGYPVRLIEDPAPPAVLFLVGSGAALAGPTVAIVGTRNATRLGCDTAAVLARELVCRGVSIVSGLALGIDGAAHRAIVGPGAAGDGVAVGVVATGLERAYPLRHQRLQDQVAASGLLVSESPIGSVPARWRFPARNRIIAGLADAVVVVESRSAGGSMLTAAEAVARDRTVLAVPGHPTAAAAAGTLDLIADGAVPVRDVDDVLVAIGLGGRQPANSSPARAAAVLPEIGPDAARLLTELEAGPRTLGELMLAAVLDLDTASDALVELVQVGLVVRSGAWFERRGPAAPRPGTRQGR